jgi:hypothetical protein
LILSKINIKNKMGNGLLSPRSKKNVIDILENLNDETIKKLFSLYEKDVEKGITKEDFQKMEITVQSHVNDLSKRKDKTLGNEIELKYFQKILKFEEIDFKRKGTIESIDLKVFYNHNYYPKELVRAEELFSKKKYFQSLEEYEDYFKNNKEKVTIRVLYRYAIVHYRIYEEKFQEKIEKKREDYEKKLKFVEKLIPMFEKCFFNNDYVDSLVLSIQEKLTQLYFTKCFLIQKINNFYDKKILEKIVIIYEFVKNYLEKYDTNLIKEVDDYSKWIATFGIIFYIISQITYFNIINNEIINNNFEEEEKLLNFTKNILNKSTSEHIEEKKFFIDERLRQIQMKKSIKN